MAVIDKNTMVFNGSVQATETTAAASQTVELDRSDNKIFVQVTHAGGAIDDALIRVKAGDGLHAGHGDLDVDISGGDVHMIGPLDSMRFKEDGAMTIEVLDGDGTAFTGTLADITFIVYEMPKSLVD